MTTAVRAGPRRTIQTDSGASASDLITTGTSTFSFPSSFSSSTVNVPPSVFLFPHVRRLYFKAETIFREWDRGAQQMDLTHEFFRQSFTSHALFSISLASCSRLFSTLLHEDF
jgi:hypothetical protein